MDFAQEFGIRLKALLMEKKMTQKELSRKCGMTEASISRYISGERICHASNLSKIAAAMGVSADYLIGLRQERSSD